VFDMVTKMASHGVTSGTIRVLCVEDHDLLAEGLRSRLSLERNIDVVGCLTDGSSLLDEVDRLTPDIVLMDLEMPGPDPFEVVSELRRTHSDVKVVILSAHVRDHYLSAAFRAGVWGYFSKADPIEVIVDGIRRVHRGEFMLGPAAEERSRPLRPRSRQRYTADSMSSKLDGLTDREQEVLRLIGRGLSRAEIARSLSRSPKTVDGHRERIMEKLDIHTGPELVRFAIREGLAEL
jgi:DNA-binding NarL/FixJ family response regulator